MNKLMMGVQRFLKDEEGTEVVEWALVAGLIVAVGAAVFTGIGTQAKLYLNNLLTAMGGTAVA
ncbi:Flp family type IVb pilin [Modicisalibacter tunisiensis]|uniref:Flp family type IVb pilin n=1 Tax=Modicisalibacter tunisiensis TaxID=390637 RepID=A0ABS7WZH2_9GAMM|nr:hypothetical protein [Modicisalibacter tunisiensis]MBZ9539054.1 hypothetical protein [Modicisalibacter tunisiensis]MBZ9567549.1 hypothetical protein [Modicisalibacter tunisiensis]